MQKMLQTRALRTFCNDKRRAEGFFHVQLGEGMVVFGPFLWGGGGGGGWGRERRGCTPSAFHETMVLHISTWVSLKYHINYYNQQDICMTNNDKTKFSKIIFLLKLVFFILNRIFFLAFFLFTVQKFIFVIEYKVFDRVFLKSAAASYLLSSCSQLS